MKLHVLVILGLHITPVFFFSTSNNFIVLDLVQRELN